MVRALPRYLPLACLACAVGGFFAVRFPDVRGTAFGSVVSTLLIALPAFVAFLRRFSPWRGLLALLGLSLFGFAVEIIGVKTGFPYGEFYYSDNLGPRVASLVPVSLPVSWAPLVLGAVAVTEPRRKEGPFSQCVAWVLAASTVLVAQDALLDPGAAHLGFWVWPDGGPYYGVPLTNYLGWLLSSLLATTLLLLWGRWWTRTRPAPGMLDSTILALCFWIPVAIFAQLWIPALLGVALLAYYLRRRRGMSDEG